MKGLLIALSLAQTLTAQSVRSRLEGRVPGSSVAPVDSLVQVANREGLPTEPLIQKAIEGGAKGVPADRIVDAVRLNLEQLRQAQAVLRTAGDAPPTTRAEVTIVAAALKRGLTVPVVKRMVAALPGERRSLALHAVADLALYGFDQDSAADLILTAFRAGLRGGRLLDVSNAAIQELERGRAHAAALQAVRTELPNVPATPQLGRRALEHARRIPRSGP
jgi:hypothetical protein